MPDQLQTRLDACDIDPALVIYCSRFHAQSAIKTTCSQLTHEAPKIDLSLTQVQIASSSFQKRIPIVVFQMHMAHQPCLPEPGGLKNVIKLVVDGEKLTIECDP